MEHYGCHATHHMGQNVQSGQADSHFYHVRLNTVKRRNTSGCKKKKQKCDSCPWSVSLGNKKLPAQVLSRVVGGEKSQVAEGVYFTIIQKEWADYHHSIPVKPDCPDFLWHSMCLHHPGLLVSVKNYGKGMGRGLEFLRGTMQEKWAACLGEINDWRRQALAFFSWKLSALLLAWPPFSSSEDSAPERLVELEIQRQYMNVNSQDLPGEVQNLCLYKGATQEGWNPFTAFTSAVAAAASLLPPPSPLRLSPPLPLALLPHPLVCSARLWVCNRRGTWEPSTLSFLYILQTLERTGHLE